MDRVLEHGASTAQNEARNIGGQFLRVVMEVVADLLLFNETRDRFNVVDPVLVNFTLCHSRFVNDQI